MVASAHMSVLTAKVAGVRRVAAGAVAKLMLRTLGIEVASHVIRVGASSLPAPRHGKRSSPFPRKTKLFWAASTLKRKHA